MQDLRVESKRCDRREADWSEKSVYPLMRNQDEISMSVGDAKRAKKLKTDKIRKAMKKYRVRR